MSDDERPKPPPVPPRRMQSQTERDHEGYRAKLERDALHNIPCQIESAEEITGKHTGEELVRKRSQRPTDERITRLETKADKLGDVVGKLEVAVSNVNGQMAVWPKLVNELRDAVNQSLQRGHAKFVATLEVDKEAAAADVEVRKAAKLSGIELAEEERKAEIENTRETQALKRKLLEKGALKFLKVLGVIAAAAAIAISSFFTARCGGTPTPATHETPAPQPVPASTPQPVPSRASGG